MRSGTDMVPLWPFSCALSSFNHQHQTKFSLLRAKMNIRRKHRNNGRERAWCLCQTLRTHMPHLWVAGVAPTGGVTMARRSLLLNPVHGHLHALCLEHESYPLALWVWCDSSGSAWETRAFLPGKQDQSHMDVALNLLASRIKRLRPSLSSICLLGLW